MARRRRLGRAVIDTMVVIRAARAFRQQPPVASTPELQLVMAWRDNPEVFTWLYSHPDDSRGGRRRLRRRIQHTNRSKIGTDATTLRRGVSR
ncbi:MAG: hypothetical protein ACREEM_12380 [Blastocatellia bacterium]